MSDYFPQEVLADILLRLPTKTLVLCLCVCKSWRSVITSPTFVHNHFTLTQNDNNRRRLFLLRHFPVTHNRERYSLYSDNYAFDKVQDLDFPLRSFNRHFRIVGSCNGVLCLSDDTTVITANFVLWNPSIRKYIYLPRPLVSCSSHGIFTYVLGFGFDSFSCDYKVVMLTYLKTKYGFYSSSRPTVNVYSLNTNSWRDVSATALSYRVVEFLWTQVFMNGAVHWIASAHDTGLERFNKTPFGNLILRFDLSHEVFDKLSLPESLVSSTQYELSITVLGDRLSVVRFSRLTYDACSIWMMKEYGVAESWTQHLEIGLSFEIPYRQRLVTSQNLGKVLGLRGNGQLILEMNDGRVLMYHPVTQMAKNLGIHGLEDSFYFDSFVESLVLLGKGTENLNGDCIQSKKRKRVSDSCIMERNREKKAKPQGSKLGLVTCADGILVCDADLPSMDGNGAFSEGSANGHERGLMELRQCCASWTGVPLILVIAETSTGVIRFHSLEEFDEGKRSCRTYSVCRSLLENVAFPLSGGGSHMMLCDRLMTTQVVQDSDCALSYLSPPLIQSSRTNLNDMILQPNSVLPVDHHTVVRQGFGDHGLESVDLLPGSSGKDANINSTGSTYQMSTGEASGNKAPQTHPFYWE